MVFTGKGMNIEATTENLILGFLLVSLLAALMPTIVDKIVEFTSVLFNETILAPVFGPDGLVVYALVGLAIISLLFKMFGTKNGRR